MMKGHLLDERYEIEKTIGGGGMANVYLAKDIILNRNVAIKVLRQEYANDYEFIQRFDREAQSATSLSHPNIVNIYDVGEEDNTPYMVMEYVDGMTLKEYIQVYGPIQVEAALDIMKQIASAIAHAHANDIVHRDIKPQNILMDTSGNVKVTDFGIAMALSATALTQTNSVLGSVHYLSPEQARGGVATKKSDIYSLGIVLYELLTGNLPFSGQTAVAIALKHLQTETPSVKMFDPSIPQSVENIVLQATTKDPFHRYGTVYDMEAALDTALDADKINEARYTLPIEEGDETKAIPIVTNNDDGKEDQESTIVHASSGDDTESPESNTQNGDKNKKKRPKRKKKWLIVSIILFVLIASGIAALFIIPGILQPKNTTVPDVVELEYDEALEELETQNLEAEKEDIFSEDIDEGSVVKTSPKEGRTVKEGSSVSVYVSQGKEKVTFDDYIGEKFSQVKQMLEGKDYQEVISIEKFSDEGEGEIIEQIQPDSDEEVVPSDTRVIFEVSKGKEPVSLNNLQGMTEDEAKDYLDEKGLEMNTKKEYSDSAPEGEVTKQDPDTDTELNEGDTVDVYLSRGPEEKPPESKTISVTVPYNPDDAGDSNNDEDDNNDDDNDEDDDTEQTVKIYIDDMNNDIEDTYQEDTITEDTDYEFTITIESDETAEYKIVRDDEEIKNKTVSYEEGD